MAVILIIIIIVLVVGMKEVEKERPVPTGKNSEYSWLTTLLLCIFFGGIGVHDFYVGRSKEGVLHILTFGGLGIWAIIDLINIITEKFLDAEGNTISNKVSNELNNSTSTSIGQADELLKYKDLLDNGIITQEEFEQKKKQLLNL